MIDDEPLGNIWASIRPPQRRRRKRFKERQFTLEQHTAEILGGDPLRTFHAGQKLGPKDLYIFFYHGSTNRRIDVFELAFRIDLLLTHEPGLVIAAAEPEFLAAETYPEEVQNLLNLYKQGRLPAEDALKGIQNATEVFRLWNGIDPPREDGIATNDQWTHTVGHPSRGHYFADTTLPPGLAPGRYRITWKMREEKGAPAGEYEMVFRVTSPDDLSR